MITETRRKCNVILYGGMGLLDKLSMVMYDVHSFLINNEDARDTMSVAVTESAG